MWLAGPMGEGKEILHKHKTSNADEVVVTDLEEGLFCLHVEAAALLSPSFKQTARRPSLMRKPSSREASECAAILYCSLFEANACASLRDAERRSVLCLPGPQRCAGTQGWAAGVCIQLLRHLNLAFVRCVAPLLQASLLGPLSLTARTRLSNLSSPPTAPCCLL